MSWAAAWALPWHILAHKHEDFVRTVARGPLDIDAAKARALALEQS